MNTRRLSMTRVLGLAPALGLALTLALGFTLPAQAQTPLRVGVEGNYPPFSKLGPDGQLSGFDIDIARALCERLARPCTLVQQEWDGMMPALRAKKFDLIVASMTISDERRKVADFSDPYYDVPSRWVARAGVFADASPAALKGQRIAVLRNSPRALHVAAKYPDSRVLLVARETDVYLELAAGRADVGFGSSVVSADAFLAKPQGKAYAQLGPLVRLDGGGSGVGIAFRKGDDALRQQVNAVLKAMKADGSYKKLADRYFDFDVSGGS